MADNQQHLTKLLSVILKGGQNDLTAQQLHEFLALAKNLREKFKEKPKEVIYKFVNSCEELKTDKDEEMVEGPLELSYVVERILSKGSQGKDRPNRPSWSKTFVYNTKNDTFGQCMPLWMYQEAKKIEDHPEYRDQTYDNMGDLFEMLLDVREQLREERRFLRGIYVPETDMSKSYTTKDGTPVFVPNPASGAESRVDGHEGQYEEKVSIDQCAASRSAEECYLHRDAMGNQACLFMPHLAHLNPPLEKGSAESKALDTLRTSHCVDRRALPFATRSATPTDELALKTKGKMLKDDKEIYQKGHTMSEADISETKLEEKKPGFKNEGYAVSSAIEKMYKAEYTDYEFNSAMHPTGNIVPVFFDEHGNEPVMSRFRTGK